MIRVYLISQSGPYREALRQALDQTGRVGTVGTARHPADAVADMATLSPQVVLMDVPGPEGPRWARTLTLRAPAVRLIVLGLVEVEVEVVAWAEAGVSGYIGVEAGLEDVVSAVEGVVRGEATCSPRTASVLLRRIAAGDKPARPSWLRERDLTVREHEVLRLVGEGLTNQQISRRLSIALATVKNHVHNLLEKLGVHSRMEAVQTVRRAGFVLEQGNAPTDPELA